jgi:hypothetical protein
MKKNKTEDELRPEYDLQSLQIRKLGPGRKKFCDTVRLEPDVIVAFPYAETVNEALRYLIEIAKHSASLTQRSANSANAPPLSFSLLLNTKTRGLWCEK